MQKLLKNFGTVLIIGLMSGCASTVTVVNSNDIVRLGNDVSGHVYTLNEKGEWVKSKNKVQLPEGWFAGGYKPK